jgi:hypothetical protein
VIKAMRLCGMVVSVVHELVACAASVR